MSGVRTEGAAALKYVLALIFCLFMGITGISLGVGTLYPPINRVAQPIVCPGGTMTYQTTVSQRRRKNYVQTAWTCEEPSGAATPIDASKLALSAGGFYGLVLFGFVAILLKLGSRRSQGAPKA